MAEQCCTQAEGRTPKAGLILRTTIPVDMNGTKPDQGIQMDKIGVYQTTAFDGQSNAKPHNPQAASERAVARRFFLNLNETLKARLRKKITS
ncbi:unnamed protein product [Anisakis simplex]|uniref:Transposase n=1 Tax=Anisakis simplex TaxID=6269 RepID=A0A0M3K4J7_ANISI|nr:unnamed protein product [Anisakis simplex]